MRISCLYQVPYSQVCLFEETNDILLFDIRNYEISILVGFIVNRMHPVKRIFDAGAGLRLTGEDFLEDDWLLSIKTRCQL